MFGSYRAVKTDRARVVADAADAVAVIAAVVPPGLEPKCTEARGFSAVCLPVADVGNTSMPTALPS